MCISRCGVVATVEDGILTKVSADHQHPNGCVCVKGTAAPEIVYSSERLQHPLRRTRPKRESAPGWLRISWDEALAEVAARLQEIKARYGAEAVVFGFGTPSGSATSDCARWVERLANAFGSPNILTAVHVCNWNRGFGARYTYGVGTPPPDYDNARCILLWGFNPQVSWPAAATRIGQARRRGAKVIAVDPRRAGAAEKADVWLRVRPGSDGALALAMIHVLFDERLYDEAFVRDWTNGAFLVRDDSGCLLTEQDLTPCGHAEAYLVCDGRSGGLVSYRADRGYAQDAVAPALDGTYAVVLADGRAVACRPVFQALAALAARYGPEQSEAITWVPAADVRRAVRTLVGEQPSCYYTWVGLEQHTNSMQTNRAVSIFFALTGQFDRRGSNVLFASTPTNPISGFELLPAEQASRRLGRAERPLGPTDSPGHVQAGDVYRAILTGRPYPVKALVTVGGDPLVGSADPATGQAALAALDYYVHVDLVCNPSATLADLLLPAATCWEREGLMPSFPAGEDTATWVQLRPAVVPLRNESRSDLAIIFELATRLGLGEPFFGGSVEAAYNWQLAPTGLTVQQLRQHPVGMRVDAQTRYQKYAEADPRTGQPRGFDTPTGKAEIYSTRFARAGYPPLPVFREPAESPYSRPHLAEEYPLVLTCSRLVQYCDEQHRHIPRLRRQAQQPYLEIHPSTAAALGVADDEMVGLETALGSVQVRARLNASLHPRVVCTQYGWWQGCRELDLPGYDPFGPEGANLNRLVSDGARDPVGGAVPHRSQLCRVRKVAVPGPRAY